MHPEIFPKGNSTGFSEFFTTIKVVVSSFFCFMKQDLSDLHEITAMI